MTESREPARFAQAEGAMPAIWNVIGVRPKTALVAVALAIVTVGIVMKWSAPVAAGIAPILISALPCAAMCALGLCMHRMDGNSGATQTPPPQLATTTPDPPTFNSVAARSDGSADFADLPRPSDGRAVGCDQLEQHKERKPTHA